MTPEAQRTAIAEACGWKRSPQYDYSLYGIVGRGKAGFHCAACFEKDGLLHRAENLPDYLNDLNAMHEAESRLDSNGQILERNMYAATLLKVCHPNPHMNTSWYVWCSIHATARQRAEAFLRTIGKWEE